MDRRCGRVTHSLFAESKKEANQAKNSHVSLLKSLNQGEKQVWAISLHPKVVQTRLVFVDAGLTYFVGHVQRNCGNIRLQIKSSRDIRSRKLTHCLSSRRRMAHPATKSHVSTLKSNNKAMLCYSDAKSSQVLQQLAVLRTAYPLDSSGRQANHNTCT